MKFMTLANWYNPSHLRICDSRVLLFHFAYIPIEIIKFSTLCWPSWSGKIDQLHYPVYFHAKTIVSTHISMLFFDVLWTGVTVYALQWPLLHSMPTTSQKRAYSCSITHECCSVIHINQFLHICQTYVWEVSASYVSHKMCSFCTTCSQKLGRLNSPLHDQYNTTVLETFHDWCLFIW